VTEERRALEALRESEKRLQRLARAVPVGIFRIDHRARHVYLHERWSQLPGIPVEQALGKHRRDPLHPHDAARRPELAQEVLAVALRMLRAQRIGRPVVEVRWVLNEAVPDSHPDGGLAGGVGTLTDLSEKNASERARAQSEESLRLALEGADMGPWEWHAP